MGRFRTVQCLSSFSATPSFPCFLRTISPFNLSMTVGSPTGRSSKPPPRGCRAVPASSRARRFNSTRVRSTSSASRADWVSCLHASGCFSGATPVSAATREAVHRQLNVSTLFCSPSPPAEHGLRAALSTRPRRSAPDEPVRPCHRRNVPHRPLDHRVALALADPTLLELHSLLRLLATSCFSATMDCSPSDL